VVTQFVGMPLGSQYVKDHLKDTNYFLFYGPPGSGKTHIVMPLCYIFRLGHYRQSAMLWFLISLHPRSRTNTPINQIICSTWLLRLQVVSNQR